MPDFGGRVVDLVVSAVEGGTDDERGAALPLEPARISPLAALSLFVKDEMAQPAHDVSFAGVPIRGAPPPATDDEGIAVSGIDWAYLRIRAT
jgi:hypothetical protein